MKGSDIFLMIIWFGLVIISIEVNHKKTTKKLEQIELQINEINIKIKPGCPYG